MLNIGELNDGYVLDHIKAGGALAIYSYLGLDKYEGSVAIIKNVRSNKMGRKDILKIEGLPELDLNILGIMEPNITIDIIRNGVITEKRKPELPLSVHGIIKCKNPRCITSVERSLPHVFTLTDSVKGTYRCKYCEQAFNSSAEC